RGRAPPRPPAQRVPRNGPAVLVADGPSTPSTAAAGVAAARDTGRALAPPTPSPAALACATLARHEPRQEPRAGRPPAPGGAARRERGGGCRVTGIPTATCAREGVLHPRAIQGYWGKQGDHYAVQNRRARHDVCPCHPSGTLRSLSTAAGESLSHRDSRREF